MDIFIREIGETDYAEVAALWTGEIMGKSRADRDDAAAARFFRRVERDETYRTFVAVLDNEVVGFVSTVTMQWIASANLFIQCIAVKKECQNKGIGTKLLKYTEEYAKTRGISGTGLQSGVQRAAAHAFYERNGYTKSFYFYKNYESHPILISSQ